VIDRKGFTIALEESAGAIVIGKCRELIAETIGPTTYDCFHAPIERCTIGTGQRRIGPGDNVLDADQRTFRKERGIAAQAALEDLDQISGDCRSDLPAETIARDVNQHRDIAAE